MPTQKINVKDTKLSLDETHHIYKEKPLYTQRYKRVLSYHTTEQFKNGIAPVFAEENGKEIAFFIDIMGKKAFAKHFKKAFGFYENLAAVCDESGFYHINENGEEAYIHRFMWCGNFVNAACVVRDKNGYFHIDSNGNALYTERFLYVGDFVYNIAVATFPNGKASHICKDGTLLHGIYFNELEPYHKGVAVAKDSKGYFHIDKKGAALYKERFIKLEPFYNGRAFCRDIYGQKCILYEEDYHCEVITPMDSLTQDIELTKKAFSFIKLQALRATLELNVLESIRDGIGVKLPKYSYNLLFSWLLQEGYIKKECSNTKGKETLSATLTQKGNIALQRKNILLYWLDLPYLVAHKLPQSLQESAESFSCFFDMDYFDLLQKDSKQKELFSSMAHFYASDYSDFKPPLYNEIVCDIGCGSGALLHRMKRENPHITPLYADKTDCIMNKEGEFIEIDFFMPLHIQADVFIMSRILHDYNEENAIKILRNIAHTMNRQNKLYIIESLQDDTRQDIEVSLHLLNFLGGKERSLSQYQEIIEKSGLKILSVSKLNSIMSVIEVTKD